MTAILHIAGPVLTLDGRVRQRCMWCGAALIDQDLAAVAVQVDEDGSTPPFPTWTPGAWIGVDGNVTWEALSAEAAERTDVEDLREPSCMHLDPEVTG